MEKIVQKRKKKILYRTEFAIKTREYAGIGCSRRIIAKWLGEDIGKGPKAISVNVFNWWIKKNPHLASALRLGRETYLATKAAKKRIKDGQKNGKANRL